MSYIMCMSFSKYTWAFEVSSSIYRTQNFGFPLKNQPSNLCIVPVFFNLWVMLILAHDQEVTDEEVLLHPRDD